MPAFGKPRISALLVMVLIAVSGCQQSPLAEPSAGTQGDGNADGALGVGSPAPPLSIAKWVTGEPVEAFEPGTVYVVEFWATWCPPCRTSIPHLSELQQHYGDKISIIGVTSEAEETVQEFLQLEQSPGETWADVVDYRMAIDSSDGTYQSYMVAALRNSIPTAFIVGKDGNIEWIGQPMDMDVPLERAVAGE